MELLKVYNTTHCPENPNMMYTREDTIRSDRESELGNKTVGIQDQWIYIKLVIRMNNFEVFKLRPTRCMGVIKYITGC